ncbi:MAG: T9SS type A sorting domain-containing protein [Bacteroidetes bacterium]|nr:T9SS type A sorting domain-containing protein [Bacteroidota bacterium]
MKKALMIIMLLCCVRYSKAQQTTYGKQNNNEQVQLTFSMKVYPNPAKTFLNVYVECPTPQSFSIAVYDMTYKTWLNEWKVASRKTYQQSIDVSKLPNGSYKVVVKTEQGQKEELVNVVH